MIDAIFVRAQVIAHMQQNPLGLYLEQFATVLHEQGYAPSSIQDSLRAGDKFGRWLQRQGHNAARVDEALLENYVQNRDQNTDSAKILTRPRLRPSRHVLVALHTKFDSFVKISGTQGLLEHIIYGLFFLYTGAPQLTRTYLSFGHTFDFVFEVLSAKHPFLVQNFTNCMDLPMIHRHAK
jgi:hypothetical protein